MDSTEITWTWPTPSQGPWVEEGYLQAQRRCHHPGLSSAPSARVAQGPQPTSLLRILPHSLGNLPDSWLAPQEV